jgi:hemerythrin-like metal-binding protein
MAESSWDESLATGNETIDRQHRHLIDLLDDLKEAEGRTESDVLRALDEVISQTFVHFHSEEDLMGEVGYPPAPTKQMIDQHSEFKAYARLRVLEFRSGVMLSVLPLQTYLAEFLKVHEFGVDRALADWIRHQNGTPPLTG